MRRPQHLERRGATFYFRIRIPQRLKPALGSTDFCKSLGTKDYTAACRRCSAATYWFETTIARMERMGADCLIRNGFWWSAALMMFSGARAGDIAQLLPSDFQFDDPVPHLVIQPGRLPEGIAKRSKFGARTHKVPLHQGLLELGIREFVEGRAKRYPGKRLLFEISLGKNRMSDGLTKFWSKYLRAFDLFKPGRATHVHRHTIAALLRAAGVSNEDIGALEFNPRKLGPKGFKTLLAILMDKKGPFDGKAVLSEARVTRLDVAVDFEGVQTDEVLAYHPKQQQRSLYVGSDGLLETFYLHGKSSKTRPAGKVLLSIYDRVRERAKRGKAPPFGPSPVTRIEIVKTMKAPNNSLAKIEAIADPFKSIRVG